MHAVDVQPRTTCNSRIADALRIAPPETSAERPLYAPTVSVQLSPASQACHAGFLRLRARLRLLYSLVEPALLSLHLSLHHLRINPTGNDSEDLGGSLISSYEARHGYARP
jgi:hypothetical protein